VNQLVHDGIPFRTAYKQVGEEVANGTFNFENAGLHHTHEGSMGNLCNDRIRERMYAIIATLPA